MRSVVRDVSAGNANSSTGENWCCSGTGLFAAQLQLEYIKFYLAWFPFSEYAALSVFFSLFFCADYRCISCLFTDSGTEDEMAGLVGNDIIECAVSGVGLPDRPETGSDLYCTHNGSVFTAAVAEAV